MKKMKRFVALALSVVMVLAMSVMAFADENAGSGTTSSTGSSNTYTITAPATDHQYEIYQIFTGDLHVDNNNTILSNIKWGVNGTGTLGEAVDQTVIAALTAVNSSPETTRLATIKSYATLTSPVATITNGGKSEVVAGYYLIKDKDGSVKEDDSYTLYIVELASNMTITPKADKPSVEKKVEENTKYTADGGYGEKYNDVADYNIGDTVPFHLIGTVPDMSGYDTYKYIFHDTLSTGLTAPAEGDVKVYLSNDRIKDDNDADITKKFTVTVSGKEITVTCDNLKEIAQKDQYIIVEYSATLNANAEIGLPGNPNEVYLEYSNNPNQEGTGKTPKDEVIVFTYELETTKVDGKSINTTLKDAEFKLKNEKGEWVTVDENGKVTGWETIEENGSTLKSGADGKFHVIGLDEGIYSLKEIKAPAGYNILDEEIAFTITATTANNQTWSKVAEDALTELKITVGDVITKVDVKDGIVGITVKNNKGSQLPSTGGIGTTIFYIVGGILMVGAAVLLITKRRAEN